MAVRRFEVPPSPCPPEEFSGRFIERRTILKTLSQVKDRGQVILISGASGSGKSSLLRWAADEIQKPDGLESPAIIKEFYETAGMGLKVYLDLLKDLKGHTKFGWFKNIIENTGVIKSLNTTLDLLETFTSITEPVGIGIRVVRAFTGAFAQPQKVEYDQILTSYLTIFRNISAELQKYDRFIAILLDDVQWSSDLDFRLLKDLVRNVPPNIAFLVTYRREDRTQQMYEELVGELNRWNQTTLSLYCLKSAEIKDLAARRYGISLADSSARCLEEHAGDPFSLIACFNLLQKKGLSPDIGNLRTVLPEALQNPARSFLAGLDQSSRDRVNLICILKQPIPLRIIVCMTETQPTEAARLQSDLDNDIVFRRVERGQYDFAHPSLREYCKYELPEIQELELHKRAAKCFEEHLDRLPDKQHAYQSLAEHAFRGEDYQKALDLNFKLGSDLYEHYDYSTALELLDRAKISAEQLDERGKLATVHHYLGMVHQMSFHFPEALECYSQSLAVWQEIENQVGEARALHAAGMLYYAMCEYDEALNQCNRSMAIMRKCGDREGEAGVLRLIGAVHAEEHQYDTALDYFNQSLTVLREIGDLDGEALSLLSMGNAYRAMHRYDLALECCKQSQVAARKIGYLDTVVRTLFEAGTVYLETQRYDEALDCYNQCLAIEREIGYRDGEALTLCQIGMVFQRMHRYDEALDCYNRCQEISQEIGFRKCEAKALYQIGTVYQETHHHDEALDHYNQSLAIEQVLVDRDGEPSTFQRIEALEANKNQT